MLDSIHSCKVAENKDPVSKALQSSRKAEIHLERAGYEGRRGKGLDVRSMGRDGQLGGPEGKWAKRSFTWTFHLDDYEERRGRTRARRRTEMGQHRCAPKMLNCESNVAFKEFYPLIPWRA